MKNEKHRKRRNKCKSMKGLWIVVLTALMMLSLSSVAFGRQPNVEMSTYYECIRVHAGDTIWGLAEAYKNEHQRTEHMVDEIMMVNGLSSPNIRSGEKIIIPITVVTE